AVKFTSEGHVNIAADAFRLDDRRFRLRVEVSDTGIGIQPEAQQRIFESFTQADETIVDRFGGTGLGLATSRQLLERAGGAIGVQSSPGFGSTFWLELDLTSAQASQDEAREEGLAFLLVTRDEAVAARVAA